MSVEVYIIFRCLSLDKIRPAVQTILCFSAFGMYNSTAHILSLSLNTFDYLFQAAFFSILQPQQFYMENLSGGHNWYTCTHARPTYCNVCRDVLSGVMNHGLSCEGKDDRFHFYCGFLYREYTIQ